MTRLTLSLLIGTAILAGCGRLGDSGWNPLGWSGGSPAPKDLAPEGGYVQAVDVRPGVPQILSASWQPLAGGRLLVVQGLAPTKGYHSAELVTQRPQPGDRLSADPDGVLRLRFVAAPPAPNDPAARLPANPVTDAIVVALPLSFAQLATISAIEIAGANGAIALRR
ncbi:hypothetical protein [Paracoccus beibuensis]|uniref:hypothetical protein n=1 Tax=Paracoccus beibuensis TaxID=547602 RepID=UPI00223FCE00|nr:hypothetical protein [Paracoccus beibuensis]